MWCQAEGLALDRRSHGGSASNQALQAQHALPHAQPPMKALQASSTRLQKQRDRPLGEDTAPRSQRSKRRVQRLQKPPEHLCPLFLLLQKCPPSLSLLPCPSLIAIMPHLLSSVGRRSRALGLQHAFLLWMQRRPHQATMQQQAITCIREQDMELLDIAIIKHCKFSLSTLTCN